MTKVELFEAIRRDSFIEKKSQRQIARERHVHRRLVRQALKSAIPPARKKREGKRLVLTDAMRALIDGWLLEDKKAPKKQKHTAHRIHERLKLEHGYKGAQSSIRAYVGRRNRELGLKRREAFVPQVHEKGKEAEVDWYEAYADSETGRRKYYILAMRACYSGAECHVAFKQQSQQAFLEGLAQCFEYFGGVFARIRFDNLGSAVKKVLSGRTREETDRFVMLKSHYLFEAEFCQVGLRGAHEKGGIEGAAGRFRRNHLVPLPLVNNQEHLNLVLLQGCIEDLQRTIRGKSRPICEDWQEEKTCLKPLPSEPFQTADVKTVRVDEKSRVHMKANRYSVPSEFVGKNVEVQLFARKIKVLHAGKVVAEHERLMGKEQDSLKLDHYLELLRIKPGAMSGSLPLRQAREAEHWLDSYDRFWEELQKKHGVSEGTKKLIDVLLLCRKAPPNELDLALQNALHLGCLEPEAVRVLLENGHAVSAPALDRTELGNLLRYETPPNPDFSVYDALLEEKEGMLV